MVNDAKLFYFKVSLEDLEQLDGLDLQEPLDSPDLLEDLELLDWLDGLGHLEQVVVQDPPDPLELKEQLGSQVHLDSLVELDPKAPVVCQVGVYIIFNPKGPSMKKEFFFL